MTSLAKSTAWPELQTSYSAKSQSYQANYTKTDCAYIIMQTCSQGHHAIYYKKMTSFKRENKANLKFLREGYILLERLIFRQNLLPHKHLNALTEWSWSSKSIP